MKKKISVLIIISLFVILFSIVYANANENEIIIKGARIEGNTSKENLELVEKYFINDKNIGVLIIR